MRGYKVSEFRVALAITTVLGMTIVIRFRLVANERLLAGLAFVGLVGLLA